MRTRGLPRWIVVGWISVGPALGPVYTHAQIAPAPASTADPALEERRLDLEERRLDLERTRIEGELAVESQRLEQSAPAPGSGFDWSNPLNVAIVTGSLGLFSAAIANWINGTANRKQAAIQARSEIILQSLKADDVERVKQNLRLVAECRMLHDEKMSQAIIAYLDKLEPGEGPGIDTGSAGQPPLGSSIVDAIAEGTTRYRRSAAFRKAREAGLPPILALGDTWMSYPLLLRDVADNLAGSYAVDHRGGNFVLAREASRVGPGIKPGQFKAAVLSLGMGDLVEWLRESQRIRRFDWQDEAILADVARHAEGVADSIAAFVAHLRSADPALPVVLHGYDRFPLDRGGGTFGGGIFSRYASGLPEPLRQQVINTYVDGLNERLAAVFKDDEKTAFCDLRGTIPEDGWYDEAHPNDGGFAIVSERLQASLERLTVA